MKQIICCCALAWRLVSPADTIFYSIGGDDLWGDSSGVPRKIGSMNATIGTVPPVLYCGLASISSGLSNFYRIKVGAQTITALFSLDNPLVSGYLGGVTYSNGVFYVIQDDSSNTKRGRFLRSNVAVGLFRRRNS
jgi:hypothetical protein